MSEVITIPRTTAKRLYVLYDVQMEEASPLYEAVSDVVAIRAFCPILAEVINIDDYKLYHVGTFDNHSLSICSCGAPQEVDFMPYFTAWLEKNVTLKEVSK